jgi:hypothetical protein
MVATHESERTTDAVLTRASVEATSQNEGQESRGGSSRQPLHSVGKRRVEFALALMFLDTSIPESAFSES